MNQRICFALIAGVALVSCKSGSPTAALIGPVEVTPVLAVGDGHACLLQKSGKVKCWGENSTGEVKGLSASVLDVAAGGSHTCAIEAGGAIKCWGQNGSGQLGDGTNAECKTPVAVAGLGSKARQIAAGGDHTCALLEAGRIKCWGDNSIGELGDGTNAQSAKPREPVNLVFDLAGVWTGKSHTCAVVTGGSAKCWGSNVGGELGVGSVTAYTTKPEAVLQVFSGKISRLVLGDGRTCATLESGEAYCWGSAMYGLCGDEGGPKQSAVPVKVGWAGNNVLQIAAGRFHTCALLGTGAVMCWGGNSSGELGDGTTEDRNVPTAVKGL